MRRDKSRDNRGKRPTTLYRRSGGNHFPAHYWRGQFTSLGSFYRDDRHPGAYTLNSITAWGRYKLTIFLASIGGFGLGFAEIVAELIRR